MATRRIARRAPGRGGLRQRVGWTRFDGGLTPAIAVAAATKVLLSTFSPTTFSLTVRRTIIQVHVATDQLAASEEQVGAIGMLVVTDTAAAAGVASIPGPSTDASDDTWFLHKFFANTFRFGSAVGFDSIGGLSFEVDSRGQRKLPAGKVLALVVENASAAQGFVIRTGVSILTGTGLERP